MYLEIQLYQSGAYTQRTLNPTVEIHPIYVHCCSISNSQNLGKAYIPINQRMDNKCGTFIQWNIILLVKKMTFVGKRIELENIILSKVAQTQKDKYCMISLICGC